LQASPIEHDGSRLRDILVSDPQLLLLESSHVGIPQDSPFRPEAVTEPLQVTGADGEVGQGLEVLAGLGKGALGAGVESLLQGRGGVALRAQFQTLIEGGKNTARQAVQRKRTRRKVTSPTTQVSVRAGSGSSADAARMPGR
jgi:hypothetical protein